MASPAGDGDDAEERQQSFTVSTIIELLGLTNHHWTTITFTWWIWIFAGWTATALMYLLDAVGEDDSDWVKLTSPAERLTMEDKSGALLIMGFLALFGNFVLGVGSDSFGRMCFTELCLLNGLIGGVGFLLARTKLVLLIFIVMNPFLKDGAPLITQSMLGEWLPIRWRGIFIVSLHAIWNVGRLAMTVVWIFIPPSDHWIQFNSVVVSLPVVLCMYTRLRGWRYESPRWLAVSGNTGACIANLKLCADSRTDGEPLPSGWDNPSALHIEAESGDARQAKHLTMWQRLQELNISSVRWKMSLLSITSFALFYATMAVFYWAIEYFKEVGLHEAIKPSMVAAPLGKILGNLLLIVGGPQRCIIDSFPRVPLLQVGYFGFGVSLLGLCASRNVAVITATMFVSHLFQEIVWAVSGVYMTEAFPTSVRNTAIGIIAVVGNMGSLIGSSASGSLMEAWVFLPILVIAALLFTAGFTCFFLPDERKDKTLSDTASYGACH